MSGCAVLLLAACGVTPTPTAGMPTVSGSPIAAAPTDSAIVATGRIMVNGTQDCGIENPIETTEGQVTTIRGTLICTDSMSNPMVSGPDEGTVTLVYADLPALEIDRWSADMTLTGDGGTWQGSGWGSEFWDAGGGLHTTGMMLYLGHGAYEGLQYRMLVAMSPEWTLGRYIVSGWIEPAGP